MGYVGKVTAGGVTNLVGSTLYGTCATAAGTAAKAVTCADFDHLLTGVTVHVKFTNSNTAASPTLNVNSTGAKPLCRYGTTRAGGTEASSWKAGAVVSVTYDGTSWVLDDFNPVHPAMTAEEIEAGTETTARVVSPKVIADYVSPVASDAASAVSTATSAHSIATSTQGAVSALAPRVTALEDDEYALATLGGTGTNQFYAHKGCATLMSAGTTPSAQWGSASVCTVPDGYRPKMQLYFPVAKTGATTSSTYIQIATNGAVTIQNWGGTQAARDYFATCTWAY